MRRKRRTLITTLALALVLATGAACRTAAPDGEPTPGGTPPQATPSQGSHMSGPMSLGAEEHETGHTGGPPPEPDESDTLGTPEEAEATRTSTASEGSPPTR